LNSSKCIEKQSKVYAAQERHKLGNTIKLKMIVRSNQTLDD